MFGILAPVLAEAATITLSPSSGSVNTGGNYAVSIYVNPAAGEKIYTAKAVLIYPATLTSVSGFSFGALWMPLSQPGYDAVDNSSGTLIKTAGYAGGISSPTLLGTITFRALFAGTVTISVDGRSQTLDRSSGNTLTSRGTATVTITPAATASPSPTLPKATPPKPTPTERQLAVKDTKVTVKAQNVAASPASSTASTTVQTGIAHADSNAEVAAAAAAGKSGQGIAWWLSALFATAALLGGFAIGRITART